MVEFSLNYFQILIIIHAVISVFAYYTIVVLLVEVEKELLFYYTDFEIKRLSSTTKTSSLIISLIPILNICCLLAIKLQKKFKENLIKNYIMKKMK